MNLGTPPAREYESQDDSAIPQTDWRPPDDFEEAPDLSSRHVRLLGAVDIQSVAVYAAAYNGPILIINDLSPAV